ncbi:MAG: addiction module protein [Terriglobales bacterium]
MAQMTPEVSELLERALMLSLEEREVLANSLISNLSDEADEGVQAAWDEEIKRRVADIRSGEAKMIPYEEVRRRMVGLLRHAAR